MNNILEIKNLHKKYHTPQGEITAIDNFSLTVKEGDFIAIVGPSGCGKSTLLSILCGLEKPSKGNITFPSKEIKLGYMLQQDCLFPWLTVLDNSLLGFKINKNITKKDKEKTLSLLKTYGLYDFIDKYPSNLSGGMRQRVA